MAGIPCRAAAAYFAAAFSAGFMLGTIRVLLIEPLVGPVWSVFLELPVMLVFCVLAARWIIDRFSVEPTPWARLRMGIAALILLVAAETFLGVFGFGVPVADQVAAYAGMRGVLTLAGQICFALIPLMVARKQAM